jgi:hypothetical protein
MARVFGIRLKLIIGETKKRHILEQRYTVESYARGKKGACFVNYSFIGQG